MTMVMMPSIVQQASQQWANRLKSESMEAPHYAVIFTSIRTPDDRKSGDNGYAATAERMDELAKGMPGYLGIESAHVARVEREYGAGG